jgi:hypothetical protein
MFATVALIWMVVIPALVVGACTLGVIRRERFAPTLQRRLSAALPVYPPLRRRRPETKPIPAFRRDRGPIGCVEVNTRRTPASHQARQPRHANP